MQRLVWLIPFLVATAPLAAAAAPATVYEATEMSPENMDYDAANKMFRAHSGWIDDKVVHYYKFRMYTPMTYPQSVKMGADPVIPVAPLYLASTDGTLAGLVETQAPILRYAHTDGELYSDFHEVVLYEVGSAQAANGHRSWIDIESSGAKLTPTGIVVNAPLVPVGSKLEAPGGGVAPIKGVAAWYNEEPVQFFFFETTSQAFADAFNPLTREGAAANAGSGFEIVVTPFARNGKVSFIPIWHFNQYGSAVEGQGGGPDAAGQRNVIDLDRLDPGYSPLWQVFWVTQVPPGYTASQASSADQVSDANGFEITRTPMYVNCPNIGPHGGSGDNPLKADAFTARAQAPAAGEVTLQGALIMEGGKTVTARVGDRDLGTATTGMMGSYRIPVKTADLPAAQNTVVIVDEAGNNVATFAVAKAGAPSPATPAGSATPTGADVPAAGIGLVIGAIAVIAVAARRRLR